MLRKKRRPRRLARLGKFMRENGIKALQVADATGISRQHLDRLRFGTSEPTRPIMIWITVACRRIIGRRRRVHITELFDLEE
jgi:transcriptional regulator with XRE-family HTH domain